ncbi:MAG: type I-E CRISPR-associated protein Cas6/Cse3/CasE [Planctomycetes bacterium]|nr:type I-E CRISPR-associated protein Cas6/Cse3/CasE [Planctomycetota bacterium]
MFLSKLVLNPRDKQARADLARPYEMHRTLWRAFPAADAGGAGRVLFRVDTDRFGGRPVVLVQSVSDPNWAALPPGYVQGGAESKPFDLRVAAQQQLRFRLRANPTKRVSEKNEQAGDTLRGKRVGLLRESDQIAWLLRKGAHGGFRIAGGWVDGVNRPTGAPVRVPEFRVAVAPEGRARNDKPGHRDGAFVAVRFDGVLEVTDPEVFRASVFAGIGTGKSYGFGLLSVAPV